MYFYRELVNDKLNFKPISLCGSIMLMFYIRCVNLMPLINFRKFITDYEKSYDKLKRKKLWILWSIAKLDNEYAKKVVLGKDTELICTFNIYIISCELQEITHAVIFKA